MTKIGEQAFFDCRSLTDVTIPESVTSIGRDAFTLNGRPTVPYLYNIVFKGDVEIPATSITKVDGLIRIRYVVDAGHEKALNSDIGDAYNAVLKGGAIPEGTVFQQGKLVTPVRKGYTFLGWYSGETALTKDADSETYTIPTDAEKGTVYTARWQAPIHEHNWSEWSVTTPAACLTAGEESRSCGVCGETETRSIPANGHSWSAWRVTTPATCVSGVESRTCACGAVETRVLPAVNEHTWDNGTVTLAPTYTMEGERTFTCTVCHGTRTESIPVRTRPSTGGSSSGSGGSSSGGSTTPPPVVIEDLDTPLADLPFTDLTTGAWYEDAITYVYSKKLMDGSNDASFSPDAMMIRGEMAQILYNLSALAGEPAAGSASCVFADVAGTNPNAAAILWAASHELVLGYGNGNFGPQDNISREQMALMLFRYAKFYGLELTWDEQVLEKFSDNAEISSWAREAMAWAVGRELIVGYGDDRVDPSGLTTRAQTASTIMRFHQMLEENSAG